MRLTSTAFQDGGDIPIRYTCDGADVSPPLTWSEVPERAQSLALIAEDPDAPERTWVHWVVVDLPPTVSALAEGITQLPGGSFGTNDWKHAAWDGPAPPQGRHHYIFKLYALDTELHLDRPTKYELEVAMAGHVLDETKLTGTYRRPKAA